VPKRQNGTFRSFLTLSTLPRWWSLLKVIICNIYSSINAVTWYKVHYVSFFTSHCDFLLKVVCLALKTEAFISCKAPEPVTNRHGVTPRRPWSSRNVFMLSSNWRVKRLNFFNNRIWILLGLLEDWTENVCRNVDNKLPIYAPYNPGRSKTSFTPRPTEAWNPESEAHCTL